jgi:hypothetical protein
MHRLRARTQMRCMAHHGSISEFFFSFITHLCELDGWYAALLLQYKQLSWLKQNVSDEASISMTKSG